MPTRTHIQNRTPCPFLPPAENVIVPGENKTPRHDPSYYTNSLTLAQSLWLQGRPAQALLQLNHALSLDSKSPTPWPLPYQAKIWLFTHRQENEFLGNPIRHYQHLASRMSGPNSELRTWRAWACFHLAEHTLPSDQFPRDQKQIQKENLTIPTWQQTLKNLTPLTSPEEITLLKSLKNPEPSTQKTINPKPAPPPSTH